MAIATTALLCVGLLFFFGGVVGIFRFPDFYSRLHPAGKLDTLGSLCMMLGLALWTMHQLTVIHVLTALKIMLCMVFIFMSSPSATHAIVDAGMRAGLLPWTRQRPQEDVEHEPQ